VWVCGKKYDHFRQGGNLVKRLLAAGCLLLAACTALRAGEPADRRIDLTVLDSAIHCGGPTPGAGAEWIDRPDGLGRLPKRLAMPVRLREYQWDPSAEGLLWIHMGTRPTGGYRLVLAAPTARLRGGVATIHVRWQEPAPGSFVTQAITSPCLLLKMPKKGIEQVVIKDQNDRTRFLISLGPSG
jgi:PrcB C-terminal